jgi:hypothetical protein
MLWCLHLLALPFFCWHTPTLLPAGSSAVGTSSTASLVSELALHGWHMPEGNATLDTMYSVCAPLTPLVPISTPHFAASCQAYHPPAPVYRGHGRPCAKSHRGEKSGAYAPLVACHARQLAQPTRTHELCSLPPYVS